MNDGQPTVMLRIGDSTMSFDESGEILETVDYLDNGMPDWSMAGICDGRGAGEVLGYRALRRALLAGEENARMCGLEIHHVST